MVLVNDCTGECKKAANTLRLKTLGEHIRPYLMLGSGGSDVFYNLQSSSGCQGLKEKDLQCALYLFLLCWVKCINLALWSREDISKKGVEKMEQKNHIKS